MPIDLPGYYFDEQRKRYFPGPRPPQIAAPPTEAEVKRRSGPPKLILDREVYGWSSARTARLTFESSCVQPRVWKYQNIFGGDGAIARADFQNESFLLLGSRNRLLSLERIQSTCTPKCYKLTHFLPPDESLWSSPPHPPPLLSAKMSYYCPSAITGVNTKGNQIFVTMLGEGRSAGSVGRIHLSDSSSYLEQLSFSELTSFWCADMFPSEPVLSLGGSRSHYSFDLTSQNHWKTAMPSDVLSQKITGRVVMCGLRQGSIIPFDVRKDKPPKRGAVMGSAVCSLTILSNENHLLASSMKGSIKLWDRRKFSSAIRSFDGHVNSHTMLGMAVDPTERLLISGGEDCAVRIWSLRSGKLLHTLRGFDCPITTVLFHDLQSYTWSAWLGNSNGLYHIQGGF